MTRCWLVMGLVLVFGFGQIPELRGQTLKATWKVPKASLLTALAFSPDGKTLAVCGDQVLKCLDVRTGKTLTQAKMDNLLIIEFSPDGKALVGSGLLGGGKLWEVGKKKLRLIQVFPNPNPSILKFTLDSRTLLTSSWFDLTIKLWNVKTGQLRKTLKVGTSSGVSIRLSPDGKTLLTCDAEGTVKFWEVATWKLRSIQKEKHGTNWHLGFSPDGKTVAYYGPNQVVLLTEFPTGKLLEKYKASGWAYSPDGKILALLKPRTIELRDARTGKLRVTLKGHPHKIASGKFCPDGRTLISEKSIISLDPKEEDPSTDLYLWDTRTGKRLARFQAKGIMPTYAFSPDGKLLATSCESGVVKIWDLGRKDEGKRMKAEK